MLRRRLSIFLTALACVVTPLVSQDGPPPIYLGPYEQPSVDQFVGEWTRSDGTYQLLIKEGAGELAVQYLNPKSINVESTAINARDGALFMSVVLSDEGYPGSTYELAYRPDYRVLAGTYTIPGQEPRQVYFTK